MKKYILLFLFIGLFDRQTFGQFTGFSQFDNFIPPSTTAIVFETETTALLARMTTPTAARQTQINTLVKSLKDAGVWSKLDVLQIYAADSVVNALLNWVSSNYNAVNTGSATFTANQGFTGNGSSMYVSTGFMPATHGVQFTQNSATMGIYDRTAGALTSGQYLAAYATAPQVVTYTSGTTLLVGRVNSAAAGGLFNANYGGAYTGLIELDRPDAGKIRGYMNGRAAILDTTALASTGLSIDSVHVLKNGAAAASYCTHQISAIYFGSTLSATEHLNLYSAIETYMDAVGCGVVPGDTLMNQNAEGTGYDYGEQMTEAGTVNEDSASRPLRGTQSIYFTNNSATLTHYFSISSDTTWFFCRFRGNDATPSSNVSIIQLGYNTAIKATLQLQTNGRLLLSAGDTQAGTTTLQDNTVYYIWFRYIVGTGLNAQLDVYLDTDNTIPAVTEATMSTGTSTERIDYVILTGLVTGSFMDQIIVIKNSMGDVEN